MNVGQIIKNERKKRNLTQTQLSELCGASNNSISGWEKNRHIPNMAAVVALASVFGTKFISDVKEALKEATEE